MSDGRDAPVRRVLRARSQLHTLGRPVRRDPSGGKTSRRPRARTVCRPHAMTRPFSNAFPGQKLRHRHDHKRSFLMLDDRRVLDRRRPRRPRPTIYRPVLDHVRLSGTSGFRRTLRAPGPTRIRQAAGRIAQ